MPYLRILRQVTLMAAITLAVWSLTTVSAAADEVGAPAIGAAGEPRELHVRRGFAGHALPQDFHERRDDPKAGRRAHDGHVPHSSLLRFRFGAGEEVRVLGPSEEYHRRDLERHHRRR